jgi:hypothetical protein
MKNRNSDNIFIHVIYSLEYHNDYTFPFDVHVCIMKRFALNLNLSIYIRYTKVL